MSNDHRYLAPDMERHLRELQELYLRVQAIVCKLDALQDDPLPAQLEQAVPGYKQSLSDATSVLARSEWDVSVSGNTVIQVLYI